jgi:hypothetical protein
MKMEAKHSSETSMDFYPNRRRRIHKIALLKGIPKLFDCGTSYNSSQNKGESITLFSERIPSSGIARSSAAQWFGRLNCC